MHNCVLATGYPVNGFMTNWKVESLSAAVFCRPGKTFVRVLVSYMETLRSSSTRVVVSILSMYRSLPIQSKAKERTVLLEGITRNG